MMQGQSEPVRRRRAMNSRPLNAAAADWIKAARSSPVMNTFRMWMAPKASVVSATAGQIDTVRRNACSSTPRNISSSDNPTRKVLNRIHSNTPAGGSPKTTARPRPTTM